MCYYRNRWYDPKIGRFISEDPIGFAGGDINLYGYVGNNPLSFVDPLGNYACRQDHRKAVSKAVAKAGEKLKGEECAAAIGELLNESFRELHRDNFKGLDAEGNKAVDDFIDKNMTAENVSNILMEHEKNFKIEYNEPKLGKNNIHTQATLTRQGEEITFTLYGGFFRNVNRDGSFRKGKTTVNQRAVTLIHEGIHAVAKGFSDEFIGKMVVLKNKTLKKYKASERISKFVEMYCK